MVQTLDVYVFRDPHFAPDGDTLVCVAERAKMERFIPKDEISRAFSGHAVYRRGNANGLLSFVGALVRRKRTYVGVWGKRNTARFKRFLQERGARLTIHRHAPPNLRLAYWATANERRHVRSLSRRDT